MRTWANSIWALLGVIGGVVSLSSLIQDLLPNLIHFNGIIKTGIDTYRSAFWPLAEFIFWCVSYRPPIWLFDYVVLGMITAIAEAHKYQTPFFDVIKFIWNTLTWPKLIWGYGVHVRLYYKRRRRPTFVKHNPEVTFSYRAAQRFTAMFVGFATLFLLNSCS